MPTIKELKRTSQIEALKRLWHGVTWLRLNLDKRHWFQHDYQFIRREARKARLM